jgi:homoserine kinase type II
MAVYTEVSFDELEVLLAAYDVGRPTAFKGIAEGVENSNFFLATERGAFVLTLYEKRVREEDLPYFLGLLEHLRAKDIRCPLPVRLRDGRLWTTVRRRPAALLTFLNGLSLMRPGGEHCAAAAAACAELHAAGADFPITRANALGPSGWRRLADATQAQADAVQRGLGALIGDSLTALEREWPTGLPAGVIHADLFPDNVLFLDGEVSGLIDFYFSCNDAFAYDLAVMQRLVLRGRRRFQSHQRAPLDRLLSGAATALARRMRGAAGAGAWRRAALPADTAVRLATPGSDGDGPAERSTGVCQASPLSPDGAPRRGIRAVTVSFCPGCLR